MKIGIIGSGNVGSALAKLWIDAGHEVILSSRHPEKLKPLALELGTRATTGSAHQAAVAAQVILLAIPLKGLVELSESVRAALRGKVVLNACNPFEERDGDTATAAIRSGQGTGLWSTRFFPGTRMVRAFNSVPVKDFPKIAHRKQDPIGIPIAADDPGALEVAAMLVKDAGFEPVVVGDLLQGKRFEPGTPLFGQPIQAQRLAALLGARKAA
jgi:hypothetical protein